MAPTPHKLQLPWKRDFDPFCPFPPYPFLGSLLFFSVPGDLCSSGICPCPSCRLSWRTPPSNRPERCKPDTPAILSRSLPEGQFGHIRSGTRHLGCPPGASAHKPQRYSLWSRRRASTRTCRSPNDSSPFAVASHEWDYVGSSSMPRRRWHFPPRADHDLDNDIAEVT